MGIMDKISSLGGKHDTNTTPTTGSEYGNESSIRNPVSSHQNNSSSIPGSFPSSTGQGSHLAGHSGSHNTKDPTYQQGSSGLGSHSNNNNTTGLGSHESALGGNHSGTSGLGSHSNTAGGLGSRTNESGLGGSHSGGTGLGSHNTQSGYGQPAQAGYGTSQGLGRDDHVNRDGYGNNSSTSGRDGYGNTSSASGYGNNSSSTGQTTAGPHNSNMLNKLDPRVDSDNSKVGAGHPGLSSTNHGSDQYGQQGQRGHSSGVQGLVPGSHAENPSAIPTAGGERVGSTDTNAYGGNSGYGSTGYQSSHQQTTAGPHDSNALNKADPRVDSDQSKLRDNEHHYGRDAALGGAGVGAGAYGAEHASSHNKDHGLGSRNNDGYSSSQPHSSTHSSQPHSSTHSSQPHSSSTEKETTAGPHKSNLLNKLDPRVDSDQSKLQKEQKDGHHYGRDAAIGGAGVGAGAYGAERAHDKHSGTHGQDSNFSRNEPYGTSSSHNGSSTAPYNTSGPHNTFAGNQLDPHVSGSERSGHGLGSSGNNNYNDSSRSGNTTAGPHKSDMLNKVDPRVDSDQSKLRDQQYGSSGRSGVDDITHGTSGMGLGSGTGHSSSQGKKDYGYSAAHQNAYDHGYKDALAHFESQRRN
nr:hypothetical protein B0A51_09921 [Rachicladosporium sp. CCFEE 5018]